MMPETILETRDLRKAFGALLAVDGVSVQVQAGAIHSIIGPNGAGKTTFFNLLSGNIRPTSGQVLYKGRDITKLPLYRTAHIGMGRSFQITNLFPNLTAFENVRLACQAMGRNNFSFWQPARHFTRYTDRTVAILEQVGLAERARQLAGTLPHGDQRKLEL
ncbi:MAG: ATP-binding cassette domain-containing protein, partial [Anaerolineae bacterium]|nr:ATP-binding cassette domain-containing protein [Anaerolineae bacterium]